MKNNIIIFLFFIISCSKPVHQSKGDTLLKGIQNAKNMHSVMSYYSEGSNSLAKKMHLKKYLWRFYLCLN